MNLGLPEQASEVAPKIDWLIHLLTYLSVFFTVAICGVMLYFAFRYRKRNGKDHETPRIEGNSTLEVIWTVMPTLVCIYVAYYGVVYYYELRDPPGVEQATIINVTGKKWQWSFQYPEQGVESNHEFVVPIGKPVRLVMTSTDVLHSFFLPAMRVKKDVVPGKFSTLSFTPVRTGLFTTFCTEYCGQEHSYMLARLKVVSKDEFNGWVDARKYETAKLAAAGPAIKGKKLYEDNACATCHSLDGSKKIGPTFLNAIGRKGTYDGGKPYEITEEYIRESIHSPTKHVVDGYQPVMPPFPAITDEQVLEIIAYMRTLKGEAVAQVETAPLAPVAEIKLDLSEAGQRGKSLFEQRTCNSCHSLDGSRLVGPSIKGSYGGKRKLADGSEVTIDDVYIVRSIKEPTAQVAEGYPPAMPAIFGDLTEAQLADLIEFIKAVK